MRDICVEVGCDEDMLNGFDRCEDHMTELIGILNNRFFHKKRNPNIVFYCDCGRLICTSVSMDCLCGIRYRVNQTPLGLTCDKVSHV